ncbi:MAG: hypothetical protein AB1753_06830, partial [Thermoproteota archaeon]
MNKSGSSAKEIGSYIEIIFYKAPKKNRDAVAQNLKKFVPWFEKHEARIEYYQFSGGEATMERIECIDKTFSASEDEDIWAELQYYPDRKHCKDTFAKMMKNQTTWKRVLGPDHERVKPRCGRVQPSCEIAGRSRRHCVFDLPRRHFDRPNHLSYWSF